MSCVHGELKLELEKVLGEDAAFALWVSCKSCAAKSLFRQRGSRGDSLPFNLTHAKWAKRAWRAGVNLGDGSFDVRLHSIESEKDLPIQRIPFDRAVWFRVVDPEIEQVVSRILVDVTSWGCHHTAYLKVIPYPAHEYVVCANCWTGCALPDANNPNVRRELYVLRTHIVGALWWQDSAGSGARSTSAATIARLRRTINSKEELIWEIADTEDNDLKFDREGEPILDRRSPQPSPASPELFNFGGRRFGKLS